MGKQGKYLVWKEVLAQAVAIFLLEVAVEPGLVYLKTKMKEAKWYQIVLAILRGLALVGIMWLIIWVIKLNLSLLLIFVTN